MSHEGIMYELIQAYLKSLFFFFLFVPLLLTIHYPFPLI